MLGNATCGTQGCSFVLATHDGGKTWRSTPYREGSIQPPGFPVDLLGGAAVVRFADEHNGWVTSGDTVSATHDGGASFHDAHAIPRDSRVAALATGGAMAYAVAYRCSSESADNCARSAVVYATPISSDRWRPVSATLAGRALELDVQGTDWYLPLRGGIYHGHGSAAPIRLPNPCPQDPSSREAPAIAVADAQHLDAMCAGGGAGGSSQYQLYGTTDGGRHWHKAGPVHRAESNLSGIADNGAGVLLVAVASGDSQILRSTDDGASLNAALRKTSNGTRWADLGFTSAAQAVTVLPGKALFLSRDSGHTWSAVRF